MRMAVEDRERGDQCHGDCHRRLHAERNDRAQHEHGCGDAGLDERHRNAGETERAACRHRQDEARRHQPQRPAAQLIGEQADRDHRQDMIEPAERMRKAVHETMGVAAAGMREGRSRDERWQ